MERIAEIKMIGNYGKVMEKTQGKVQAAMGYITTWAFPSEAYGYVDICISESDCEISALYKPHKDHPARGLLMVGVWRPTSQEYTFHT